MTYSLSLDRLEIDSLLTVLRKCTRQAEKGRAYRELIEKLETAHMALCRDEAKEDS